MTSPKVDGRNKINEMLMAGGVREGKRKIKSISIEWIGNSFSNIVGLPQVHMVREIQWQVTIFRYSSVTHFLLLLLITCRSVCVRPLSILPTTYIMFNQCHQHVWSVLPSIWLFLCLFGLNQKPTRYNNSSSFVCPDDGQRGQPAHGPIYQTRSNKSGKVFAIKLNWSKNN